MDTGVWVGLRKEHKENFEVLGRHRALGPRPPVPSIQTLDLRSSGCLEISLASGHSASGRSIQDDRCPLPRDLSLPEALSLG